MEKGKCFGCIKKGVCYSEEDKMGWCEDCAVCAQKDCSNPIKYRIHWPVGDNGAFTLCRDVCEKHSSPSDCNCSEHSKIVKMNHYTYF